MCCATARREEAGDQTCPDGIAWLRVRQLGRSRGRTYCQRHVRPSSEALFAVSWNWLPPNESSNTRLSFRAEPARSAGGGEESHSSRPGGPRPGGVRFLASARNDNQVLLTSPSKDAVPDPYRLRGRRRIENESLLRTLGETNRDLKIHRLPITTNLHRQVRPPRACITSPELLAERRVSHRDVAHLQQVVPRAN